MTTKQGQKIDGAANRAAISELQLSAFPQLLYFI